MEVEGGIAWKYWKPLSDVFLEYINHPEAKFEGDIGILQRRHLNLKDVCTLGRKQIRLKCRN
jgi:hypothetical protein